MKKSINEIFELDAVFSEKRFRATVENITVYNDGKLKFLFKNGTEITVEM